MSAEGAPRSIESQPPNAPEPLGRSLAVDVSTVAGAGMFSSGVGPVARVGGFVAIASRRGVRPSVALGVLYGFPFEAGDDVLRSRATTVSLRAVPSLEVLRKSRFALDANAGLGLDILSVAPSSGVLPASALSEPSTRVEPMLEGGFTGRLALASDVVLTLSAAADIDLATRRYVFDDRGQRGTVFAPWTVRPMLLAGLSFTAFGEAPFSRGR
jgi:hypothetical protein